MNDFRMDYRFWSEPSTLTTLNLHGAFCLVLFHEPARSASYNGERYKEYILDCPKFPSDKSIAQFHSPALASQKSHYPTLVDET